MQTAAFYVGALGAIAAALMIQGGESLWWLMATLVGHVVVASSLSVGYHRLFTHRAFRCRRFWHYFFAVFGVLGWTGSPMQWAALHTTHHRYSDTDQDPHITSWTYFFWKRYRPVKLMLWRTRRLLRDPLHHFVHNYYALIGLALMGALALIDVRLLVFGYLVPVFMISVGNGLHQVISHRSPGGRKARDFAALEFVLPVCGEWMHGRHHEDARAWNLATKWWHFDLGAWIIKGIRS